MCDHGDIYLVYNYYAGESICSRYLVNNRVLCHSSRQFNLYLLIRVGDVSISQATIKLVRGSHVNKSNGYNIKAINIKCIVERGAEANYDALPIALESRNTRHLLYILLQLLVEVLQYKSHFAVITYLQPVWVTSCSECIWRGYNCEVRRIGSVKDKSLAAK